MAFGFVNVIITTVIQNARTKEYPIVMEIAYLDMVVHFHQLSVEHLLLIYVSLRLGDRNLFG